MNEEIQGGLEEEAPPPEEGQEENLNQEEPPEEDPVEAEARKYNWVPREEFQGNPDDWVPAQDYLDFANPGKARKTIKGLEREVSEMKAQQARFATNLAESKRKADQEGYERAMAELDERTKRAFADDDADELDRIAEARRKLSPPADAPKGEEGKIDPDLERAAQAFMAQNPQVQYVPGMMSVAQGIEAEILQTRQDIAGDYDARFAAVRERLATFYPQHFGGTQTNTQTNGRTRPVQPVSQTGRRPAGPKKAEGFASLPKAFQEEGRRAIARGQFKDEEAYYKATAAAFENEPGGIPTE